MYSLRYVILDHGLGQLCLNAASLHHAVLGQHAVDDAVVDAQVDLGAALSEELELGICHVCTTYKGDSGRLWEQSGDLPKHSCGRFDKALGEQMEVTWMA